MTKKLFIILFISALVVSGCKPLSRYGEPKEDIEKTISDNSDKNSGNTQMAVPAPTTKPGETPVDEMIVKPQDDATADTEPKGLPEDESGQNEASQPIQAPGEPVSTSPAPAAYSGQKLAGNASPLLDFNQQDYESALRQNKNIVLYFYATWCPICAAEFPKMQAAFNELDRNDIVGFRVNINDNDTDNNEKQLANAHGVLYQHTKVFVQNGKQIYKAPDSWDKQKFLNEIANRF